MKIIVFGGDGFCGWASSLHLSKKGHDVVIVDNLSRRNIDNELMLQSLTPIQPMDIRIKVWEELTGHAIRFFNIDIAHQYHELLSLIKTYQPDAIVHFAEQRAAPYSMKSSKERRYTVNNNVNATHHLLSAIVESQLNPHLVHLGTMGVYGYDGANQELPEGYLRVFIPSQEGGMNEQDILYPTDPGSIYHMTKSLDQIMFQFYAKNYQLKITDLHQGIVWGTQTKETLLDERLINRFDYDGDYGTVLNRFLMQAALQYPLTVHGTGKQKRAFISIRDTVRCIELAILHPPKNGSRVKIFNQTTEAFRIIDLAKMVSTIFNVDIQFVENPRNEKSENELSIKTTGFKELGLTPTLLENGLLEEAHYIALKYKDRCDISKIPCLSYW